MENRQKIGHAGKAKYLAPASSVDIYVHLYISVLQNTVCILPKKSPTVNLFHFVALKTRQVFQVMPD